MFTTGAAARTPVVPINGDTPPTPDDIGFGPPVLGFGDCTNRTEKMSFVLTVARLASELLATEAQSRPLLCRHDPRAAFDSSRGPPIIGIGDASSLSGPCS